jgi:hypothetical protein
MNPTLRALVASVGLFVVGGVTYNVFIRTPPGSPITNLRDAGLLSERTDRFVLACPEKITTATRNYLRSNGYGTFAVGSIHRVARVVIEHTLPDGGKELVNPSLDVFAAEDAGDEEDETDDSLQFRTDDCFRLQCNDDSDAGIRELNWLPDGGARHPFPDGGPRPWCNVATRRGRVTPPCVIPDCWTLPDGGWNDDAVVDCRGTGPFGVQPGGAPRWRGCNTTPAQFATGTACVPVECSVVAGDGIDVLR